MVILEVESVIASGKSLGETSLSYLEQRKLTDKIVALATDGVSEESGMVAFYKQKIQGLVTYHCLAFKLNLGLSDIR